MQVILRQLSFSLVNIILVAC